MSSRRDYELYPEPVAFVHDHDDLALDSQGYRLLDSDRYNVGQRGVPYHDRQWCLGSSSMASGKKDRTFVQTSLVDPALDLSYNPYSDLGIEKNRSRRASINKERPKYKPSALRWPYLSSLLVLLLVVLGLLAYAQRSLPIQHYDKGLFQRDLLSFLRRQNYPEAPSETYGASNPPSYGNEAQVSEAPAPGNYNSAPQGPAPTKSAEGPGAPPPSHYNPGPVDEPEPDPEPIQAPSPEPQDSSKGEDPIQAPPAIVSDPQPPDKNNDPSVDEPSPDTTSPVATTRPPAPAPPASHYNPGPVNKISLTDGNAEQKPPPVSSDDSQGKPTKPTLAPPKEDYNKGPHEPDEPAQPIATPTVVPVIMAGTQGEQKATILPVTHNYGAGDSASAKGYYTKPPAATASIPRVPVTVTLTNSAGSSTAVSSSNIRVQQVQVASGLTDSTGKMTATTTKTILGTYSYSTMTDSSGVATATVAKFYEVSEAEVVWHEGGYHLSQAKYFIGMFLPTLVATFLSLLVRIVHVNAQLFQPWAELARSSGATGRDSLCCATSGWRSLLKSLRSLFGGRPLVFFTTVLMLCATLLVPLSSEAVAFRLYGADCHEGGVGSACRLELSVFDVPVKVTIGILVLMAVCVLMLLGFLLGWNSGVGSNPWSIAGISSLSTNRELRNIMVSLPAGTSSLPSKAINEALSDRRFVLGYFDGPNNSLDYGITLASDFSEGSRLIPTPQHNTSGWDTIALAEDDRVKKKHLPFVMLRKIWRLCFLLVLLALQALILYYVNTYYHSSFEKFMDSQGFGVRFLFSTVGVIVVLLWQSFFDSITVISPYYLLSLSSRPAKRSILQSQPTNQFSGLATAISRRHYYLAIMALISIFTEFLPLLLCNIPFNLVKSSAVHVIIWRVTIAVLGLMTLAIVYSFFVKWPFMPVDPSTIAGAMYYVCDSWMLERLGGVSVLARKERDWKFNMKGTEYGYGEIYGVSGTKRLGVDMVEVDRVAKNFTQDDQGEKTTENDKAVDKNKAEEGDAKQQLEASAGVEIVCSRCYTKGKATATLSLEGDFNTTQVMSEVEDSVSDTIDQIKEWVKDVEFDFKELEFDIPAPNITFDIDMPALPGAVLEFKFEGIEMFVELEMTLGAGLSYSLNIYKSTQLGIELAEDLFLGLVFSIDLMLSVDSEITITSGFHLLLDEGILLRLALFAKETSDVEFNPGKFEFLPVTVEAAGAVLRGVIQLSLRSGFSFATPDIVPGDELLIGDFDLNDLTASAGIEARVYANVAELVTNVTANTDDDAECALNVIQEYAFAVGAAAGATAGIGPHVWGPVGATEKPLFATTLASKCAIDGPKVTPTPTLAERAPQEDDEEMTTTTLTTEQTFIATLCASTGLVACPASLRTVQESIATRTLVTAVPSGVEASFPEETTLEVLSTVDFGNDAKSMVSETPTPTPTPTPESEDNDDIQDTIKDIKDAINGKSGGVSNKLIIGLSVGLGVPFLLALVAGLIFWRRRRNAIGYTPAATLADHDSADTAYAVAPKPKEPTTQVYVVNGP
ncbi:hypothetical protein HJFPF1_05952 [Paramyrothecium foliicola]|nr:hypothetical protein HJFPF1_05952 [Paramyrothecium foliicola]